MVWKIWALVWVKWRQYEYILFIKPLRPQNVEKKARPVQTQVGLSANTLQLSNNYIWYLYVLYKRSLGYTFVGSKKTPNNFEICRI